MFVMMVLLFRSLFVHARARACVIVVVGERVVVFCTKDVALHRCDELKCYPCQISKGSKI